MGGVVTERNWKEIERSFPGMHTFYSHLPRKPKTFLQLMELYGLYKSFTSRQRDPCQSHLSPTQAVMS